MLFEDCSICVASMNRRPATFLVALGLISTSYLMSPARCSPVATLKFYNSSSRSNPNSLDVITIEVNSSSLVPPTGDGANVQSMPASSGSFNLTTANQNATRKDKKIFTPSTRLANPKMKLNLPANRTDKFNNSMTEAASQNHENWLTFDGLSPEDLGDSREPASSHDIQQLLSNQKIALDEIGGEATNASNSGPSERVLQLLHGTPNETESMIKDGSRSGLSGERRRAKFSSNDEKSDVIPSATRRNIIQNFIKNGGKPDEIAVGDSTITTVSRTEQKTVTTVYKLAPQQHKPRLPNNRKEIDLNSRGNPVTTRSPAELVGLKRRPIRKRVEQKTLPIPQNSELDDDDETYKKEADLGEFYRGPQASLSLNGESGDASSKIKKGTFMVQERPVPAVESKRPIAPTRVRSMTAQDQEGGQKAQPARQITRPPTSTRRPDIRATGSTSRSPQERRSSRNEMRRERQKSQRTSTTTTTTTSTTTTTTTTSTTVKPKVLASRTISGLSMREKPKIEVSPSTADSSTNLESSAGRRSVSARRREKLTKKDSLQELKESLPKANLQTEPSSDVREAPLMVKVRDSDAKVALDQGQQKVPKMSKKSTVKRQSETKQPEAQRHQLIMVIDFGNTGQYSQLQAQSDDEEPKQKTEAGLKKEASAVSHQIKGSHHLPPAVVNVQIINKHFGKDHKEQVDSESKTKQTGHQEKQALNSVESHANLAKIGHNQLEAGQFSSEPMELIGQLPTSLISSPFSSPLNIEFTSNPIMQMQASELVREIVDQLVQRSIVEQQQSEQLRMMSPDEMLFH